jgi:O-antigen/teichoic acid export membrane protein
MLLALIFIFVLVDVSTSSMLFLHVLSMALACLVSVVLSCYNFFKFIYPSKRESLSFSEIKDMFAYGIPVYLTSISSHLTSQLDTLCIGYFMEEAAVASYSSVVTVARNVGYIVSTIFSNILRSTLSFYYGKGDMKMFKKITENSLKWYLFFGLPLLLVFLVYPLEVMTYFFNDYADAYWLFYILGPTFFMMVLSAPYNTALYAAGKSKVFMAVMLVMIVPNFLLNILLIPQFGLLGAACATMFSFVLSKLIFIYYCKKNLGIWFPKDIHKVIVSGLAMLVCLVVISYLVNIEAAIKMIVSLVPLDIPLRIIGIFVLGVIIGLVSVIYLASFILQKPFTDVEKRMLNRVPKLLPILLKPFSSL